MMRAVLGVAASMLAAPILANGQWQVVKETPAETISVERPDLHHSTGRVRFRERHVFRGRQIDPASLRPIREILVKRMADCPGRRIATLSRAVFSDNDALIDYRAVRPLHAEWIVMARDDMTFRLVCGPL
ncbi:MAG: hypothetical protein ACYCZA_10910 [Thiobacillus sp.]